MFKVGSTYTRAEVLRALGIEDTGGGVWYTGLAPNGDDHYIFCGVGTPGRTGHDYGNHFDGPDLIWRGRTGSQREHPSIQGLIGGRGQVHIFFREDDRQPFTYAGTARAVAVNDAIPVEIRWSFRDDPGLHPEYLPEEVDEGEGQPVKEGAKRTITVNVYERDPAARFRCIRKWGAKCVVCNFDFGTAYGDLGQGFIHVHHLRPLAEIGSEYVLDPEADLRPVCPNCHAMLHRTRPPLSIDALRAKLRRAVD